MGRKRVQVSMLLACAALAASCGHSQKNAPLLAGSLAGRKVVMIVAHRDFRDEIGRDWDGLDLAVTQGFWFDDGFMFCRCPSFSSCGSYL